MRELYFVVGFLLSVVLTVGARHEGMTDLALIGAAFIGLFIGMRTPDD